MTDFGSIQITLKSNRIAVHTSSRELSALTAAVGYSSLSDKELPPRAKGKSCSEEALSFESTMRTDQHRRVADKNCQSDMTSACRVRGRSPHAVFSGLLYPALGGGDPHRNKRGETTTLERNEDQPDNSRLASSIYFGQFSPERRSSPLLSIPLNRRRLGLHNALCTSCQRTGRFLLFSRETETTTIVRVAARLIRGSGTPGQLGTEEQDGALISEK